MGDPLDPRVGALARATSIDYAATAAARVGGAAANTDAPTATGLIMGLVYIGDRLEDIRRELWNANNNGVVDAEVVEQGAVSRTLEMLASALPVEARNAMLLGLGVKYTGGDGEEKLLDPLRVTLYYPKGRAPEGADVQAESVYKRALERIAKHEEHMGSGPPDDEMREIAIGALAAGERR